MQTNKGTAVSAVILATVLFGALGICSRYFHNDCGLQSTSITAIRLTFSFSGLLILMLLFGRHMLAIDKKYIPFFFLFGFFKFMADVTFFHAQNCMSLCMSTLLQMTAPYFVVVFSYVLFKEKITSMKVFAMVVGTAGCVLVTDVLFGNNNASLEGILSALFSGLCYSTFFVGNKMANDRDVRPTTMLLYSTLFADLLALPFTDIPSTVTALSTPTGLMMGLTLGLALTLIPYFLMAWSSSVLDPTIISIVSVLEVVSASIIGFIFFHEGLDTIHIVGMILVILSIVLINIRIRRSYFRKYGAYISPLLDLGKFIVNKTEEMTIGKLR